MELAGVLDKVRGLIAKAESLESAGDENSMHEADVCRAAADRMMQKYAVEEWQILRQAPATQKPTRIKIDIGEEGDPFLSEAATLVNVVATFCKCKSIWILGSGYRPTGRQEYCWVYGYDSDLRYFELLYTSLYLHMSGAIFPSPDPLKTLGQNAYELHNAGLNWFDIAKAYGWREVKSQPGEARYMYVNRSNPDERVSWAKSIGRIKSAYAAEIKARGEKPFRIPPSGSGTFRRNAAQGYLTRIDIRLRRLAGERGAGTELVLADKTQNIAAMVASEHPDLSRSSAKRVTYNQAAYERGINHANTASLQPEAGQSPRQALS